MMNELAEIIGQLEFSEENRKKSCGAYSNPILRKSETEAIIKALRFAADMERLVQAGCEPGLETQVDNPDNPDDPERCVVRWWNGRHWQFSYGVDYYTAARKAVEALEKGEGDG